MIYSIENDLLKISVNTKGAELYSLFSKKTNTEYLWQGDPKFWSGRAYNLFPFIGRMVEFRFLYEGISYPSRAHGLARYFEFSLECQTENSLTFLFKDDEETHKEYPFDFEFRVIFLLDGAKLTTRYEVTNVDHRTLICAFGGHPGINVPFGEGVFEDYYFEFPKCGEVKRQLLRPNTAYMEDKAVHFPLADGNKMPFSREIFLHDAVILENTGGYVELKNKKESRYVSMEYSDYKFIGFWQMPLEGTPYICLEPWSALPAIHDTLVELESKPHMTHVPVGEKATKTFILEIHE